MGEEKKEAGKKEEEEKKKEEEVKKEEKKEEEKKDELINEDNIIVLKVDMHCEACARKVARSLKGFHGVEEVTADCKASRVVVKGKAADPVKVSQRIQKKSGRKVVIISPLPKPPPPENKAEEKKEEEPPKEEKKDEPPPVITVVLKVRMHCEACAQVLEKRIRKVKGVESVTADIGNDKVTVKGVLDPEKLVNDVYKRTGKQASIVKEEEKKEEQEVKKDEEKKDEKQDEKKESKEDDEEEESKKMEIKKMEYWPPKYYMDHAYAPQLFSDENPNACSVM
ncbi:hypothetical protein ABFS83_13G135600 [Erythranthe nasuta]